MRPSVWGTMVAVAVLAATVIAPAYAQRAENLVFEGNMVYDCGLANGGAVWASNAGPVSCPNGRDGNFSTEELATVRFTTNTVGVDPLLNDPLNLSDPDWRPAANSPALCVNGATVIDAYALNDSIATTGPDDDFLAFVDYVGAFGPDEDWTDGWIYTNQNGGTGRGDIDLGKPAVVLTTDVTAAETWTAANNYFLANRIAITNGATLTIEPGTVVMGTATTSYLVVERDGTLIANGTAAEPIVFTSGQAPGSQAPGDWGGVVIHGEAVANCAAFEGCALTGPFGVGPSCESEGAAGNFGGDNDDDSSGVLRYCRIEYSGREISPNNELNCLTMNAVGRNTIIEHVQACWGTDDGHEFFGGTARCRWLVATSNADDNLDWQMGFRGEVQFAVVQQNADFPGDRGIEADNNEYEFDCVGRSNPIVSNLTLIGAAGGDRGIELRRGTAGRVINSIIQNWDSHALRVSDDATYCNGAGSANPTVECPLIAVDDLGTPAVAGFAMTAAPNPVFATSSFQFSLDSASDVRIGVYGAAGRFVAKAFDGRLNAGQHAIQWVPGELPAGVYYFEAEAGSRTTSGKLLLLD